MSMKGNCCAICGVKVDEINDNQFCFHHPNPQDKTMNISAHRGKKEDIIYEAVHKTILVCKADHAKIHSEGINVSELKILQDNNNKIAQLALEQTQRINRLLRGA